MKKIIIVLGTPCSGKKTHAKLLSKEFNYKYFSSIEFIEEEIKNETSFGLIAKKYSELNRQMPDEYLIRAVKEQIINLEEDGIVLNGFPNTVSQAKALDTFLFVKKIKEPIVIYLYAENTILINRIASKNNLLDGKNEIFKKTMNAYEVNGRLIADYYTRKYDFDTEVNELNKTNENIILKIKNSVN